MSNNNFFLDIFNKLLKINDDEITILIDDNNVIWFKFRDILKALGYNNIYKAMRNFNLNKKYTKYLNKMSLPTRAGIILLHPHTKFINESGLYELLSNSNKPLATIFKEAGDKNLFKIFNPHASSQDLFKNL